MQTAQTQSKQAMLVPEVSQMLPPDAVFIILPVFGLRTNHSPEDLMFNAYTQWRLFPADIESEKNEKRKTNGNGNGKWTKACGAEFQ